MYATMPALREAIADGRHAGAAPLVFRPDTLTIAVRTGTTGLRSWRPRPWPSPCWLAAPSLIATGWSDGVAAPLFAAVVGSLLAASTTPSRHSETSTGYSSAVIAVHGIYLLA